MPFPRCTPSLVAALIACLCLCGGGACGQDVDFDRDVRPLLADKCYHCHGPDASQRDSDLRLDDRQQVFDIQDGAGVVVPGDPARSSLLQRITAEDADERMPPADAARQLTADEIDILRRWIRQGASWSTHWAYKPPQRPRLPAVQDQQWPLNAVDYFVLAKLESLQLTPSEPADKATLLRRVTLDLTGLPPTPDEMEAFLRDAHPDAYQRVVERLLASPRYGEHMAVPWLDAARYADTDGYQNDRLRYMWVWRDWVIQALNAGLPFDEFTIQQLAGDMLPEATIYEQIATGFCRNHRINSEGGSIPAEWAVEYVADRVETLGTVWLGLTLNCARCHDHKYDPVTQHDFYRLFAYFNNVPEWGLGPNNGNSPPFIPIPDNWPHLSTDQQRLITPAPYTLKTTQTSVVRPNPGGPNTVMVMREQPEPRPAYVLRRGLYNQPDKSESLSPGVPTSLGELPEGGDRLALARWLVSPQHPLTARVVANRQWQHLFGAGIVRTSENFGVQGEPPSHPQLLDWLARELIHSRWDVKRLHRLIVTSAAYRQSSRVSDELLAADPANRLLARGARHRLPAHVIRDQALAVSGLMCTPVGGPSVKPYMPPGIWKSISNAKYVQDHGAKLYRRSLYTYWRRTVPPPTMTTFNAAEREVCTVRKDRTNSPLQALTLMNNVLFVEASRMLAERMMTEGGEAPRDQLAYGFRLAAGRQPSPAELSWLEQARDAFGDHYAHREPSARQLLSVGEHPRRKSLNTVEWAAMTMTASAILNLDEVVTKH